MLCVASAQASEWSGSSLSLRSSINGIYCRAGPVQLSIDGEIVHGSANSGIALSGRLAADGSLSLSGGLGGQVSFNGKKTGNRVSGSWVEGLSGCGGTWRADEIEPVEPGGDPSQTPPKADED
jgi:hypothetical protein